MPTTPEEMDALPAMLRLKDIASYMRVSRETARQIAQRPGFPLFRHLRLRRVPKDAFLRWVAAQTGQDPEAG